VDRDSRQLLIDRLDLLGVQADPGLDAQAADRIAQAELIARAGPAKAANKPSPVVATTQPPNRSSSARRIRYHAAPVGAVDARYPARGIVVPPLVVPLWAVRVCQGACCAAPAG